MATPILQSINAFAVESGTTLTFSVIGATNVVKKTVVNIYDSSNVLVATNTDTANALQSKHVIPANLSGIANGNQYNCEILIYYSTEASATSQGTSARVAFWCLPQPTISITAPALATTTTLTSYDFQAQYNTNYGSATIAVSNKIQMYKFDLYKGNSTSSELVDTSEYIYGTGEQASTVLYNLINKFSNLENNTTYFVKVYVITEQGMEVEASSVSTLLTVSYTDVALPAPTVVNNSCEGYINVSASITNIQGFSSTNVSSGRIDLTDPDDYVVWGYDPSGEDTAYTISFPTVNWSMILTAKSWNASDTNPLADTEGTYLIKLASLDGNNAIYVYPRQYTNDDNEVKTFAELYAISSDSEIISFVQSDELTDVGTSDIYILISCNNGWFDVQIQTSLPSEQEV